MTNCANCTSAAVYVYTITDAHKIYYCQSHLPRSLQPGKTAGISLVKFSAPAVVASKKEIQVEAPKPAPTKVTKTTKDAPAGE